MQGKKALIKNVLVYNESLSRFGRSGEVIRDKSTEKVEIEDKIGFQNLQKINKNMNKIFN